MTCTYLRNFLATVLVRVDFATPFWLLRDGVPTKLGEAATSHFRIRDSHTIQVQQVTFGDTPAQAKTSFKEWHFWNDTKEKHLVLNPDFTLIEFTKYDDFAALSTPFKDILECLYELNPHLQINRLGLRYINRIQLRGARFSWRGFISPKLLTILQVPSDRDRIARAMASLELNHEDHFLRFQYGMQNPDYPAAIKQKVFTLDFDAYARGSLAKDDALQQLPIFHKEIKELFEASITPKLREVMNAR